MFGVHRIGRATSGEISLDVSMFGAGRASGSFMFGQLP